jgi:hypothetical protein
MLRQLVLSINPYTNFLLLLKITDFLSISWFFPHPKSFLHFSTMFQKEYTLFFLSNLKLNTDSHIEYPLLDEEPFLNGQLLIWFSFSYKEHPISVIWLLSHCQTGLDSCRCGPEPDLFSGLLILFWIQLGPLLFLTLLHMSAKSQTIHFPHAQICVAES